MYTDPKAGGPERALAGGPPKVVLGAHAARRPFDISLARKTSSGGGDGKLLPAGSSSRDEDHARTGQPVGRVPEPGPESRGHEGAGVPQPYLASAKAVDTPRSGRAWTSAPSPLSMGGDSLDATASGGPDIPETATAGRCETYSPPSQSHLTGGHVKTRLWICDRCGCIRRRYLSGEKAEWPHNHCGQPMRKAFRFPDPDWYKKFERKAEKREAARQELLKKYSRCWNSEGHILQVSWASIKAWRAVEELQLKGSPFIKRAKIFLTSMRKDLGQFGSQGIPDVVFEEALPGALGMYQRSLWQGWRIRLLRNRPLPEIRATFLHEVLHWIDDQAYLGVGGNGGFGKLPSDHYQFEPRLSDLRKRLQVKES